MSASTQDKGMAVNIPPNAPQHVYAAAAEQALAWGRADGALETCELGLSRHPAYAGLRLFRAEALMKFNRVQEAEADLRAVLEAEPQHPRAIKDICYLLMDLHRFREALPFLQRADFLLAGDTDIPEWLKAAEQHANDEPEAPASLNIPALSVDALSRAQELSALPGVHAVSLSTDDDVHNFGEEIGAAAGNLKRLPALESEVDGILADVGFGSLSDVALHSPSRSWLSRRGKGGMVRVAADSTVREGLLAWHISKVLGEESE